MQPLLTVVADILAQRSCSVASKAFRRILIISIHLSHSPVAFKQRYIQHNSCPSHLPSSLSIETFLLRQSRFASRAAPQNPFLLHQAHTFRRPSSPSTNTDMASRGNGRRSSADSLTRDLDTLLPSNRDPNYQPSYQPTYDHSHDTTYDPNYNSRRTQHPPSPNYPTYANPTSSSGRSTGNRTSAFDTTGSYSSPSSYPSSYASSTHYPSNQYSSPSSYNYSNGNMNSSSGTASSNAYKPDSNSYRCGSVPPSAHGSDKRSNKGIREKDSHGGYDAPSSRMGGEEMRREKRGGSGNGSGRSCR